MEQLKLEFPVGYKFLCDRVGYKYSIYMRTLTTDLCIQTGVIESIEHDYHHDLLVIHLEDCDNKEVFTLSSLKSIQVGEQESYDMVKITYQDDSYFKIYLTKKEID